MMHGFQQIVTQAEDRYNFVVHGLPPLGDEMRVSPLIWRKKLMDSISGNLGYYCAQPPGYYPYVPTCPSGWQAVPATPQESPAPVAPPTHEDLQREQRSDVGHGMAMPHLYT